ncbi:4'-phosphopantetheinyl transferase family protein [Streptomyces sp. NPDC127097]|uniref:4'-phosphopantetheinyl transferase family protein n=1 Tax=Streptomyces sp. NPDC127097 TaxID=3347136 RepID=UPI0036647E1D
MTLPAPRAAELLSTETWSRRPGPPEPGEPADLRLTRTADLLSAAAELAPSVLSRDERDRAGEFRRAEDRNTYLVTHVALRMLLGGRLGAEPARVPLDRAPCLTCGGPHGRPVVRGNPVHFSLSHTGHLGLIALAAVPVGVDIEAVPAAGTVDGVATALHPKEAAELTVCQEEERGAAFARVWVRKEAYLKGLGIGLGRDPSLDYLGTAAHGAVQPHGWEIADVVVADGHRAAVATRLSDAGEGPVIQNTYD